MPKRLDPSLPRREFLKAAVAVGGASALTACLDRSDGEDRGPVPTGVDDPSDHPSRQHGWNDHVRTDDHGNTLLPTHQVLLYLNLPADGPPTADQRQTVERALATLDRAYEWSNEGLVHSMAYSPAYFERFDDDLPPGIDLPQPCALSDFEDPDLDTQDALLHIGSDRADVVLAAEQALTGERDSANGVEVEATLTDAFDVDSRRTGFIGAGLPAENADVDGIPDGNPIPEASPLFMGFTAGFAKNQASEDYVTISRDGAGKFAGGTTKVVANLRQRLEDWYGEQNRRQRVTEMFSPGHAEEDLVEGVGENLGDDSGIDRFLDRVSEDAAEFGRVGHAQKAARANRDDEGAVKLLRRHFESTDDDHASLHFPSLQRRIADFEAVREAMNGTDATEATPAVRQRVNNGILEYVFVDRRGNFLVPPRDHRALPTPRSSG